MKQLRFAFLLYPTAQVKIDEDSSFWIMWELLRRGHEVFYFESRHLVWRGGSPLARLAAARLDRRRGYLPSPPGPQARSLLEFDGIFIRKEPPFDTEYLYALQLLAMIKDRVFIVNDPEGIALANEKLFTLEFPALIPESAATSDVEEARGFIRGLKARAVVKPLHQKGGTGVFAVDPKDRGLVSLLEVATAHGRERVLIQRYIPAERHGDKRILILDGRALGAFVRYPSPADFRANLSAGGSMRPARLTPHDERIVAALAPVLRRHGLFYVGIDVIGRYLTEINVTSPAGIPEINAFGRKHLEREVADFLEERLSGF